MNFSKIRNMRDDINNAAIELYGDKRVIDYSKECIVLDLGSQKVKISGEELVADSFVFGQTDITGKIKGLEFV